MKKKQIRWKWAEGQVDPLSEHIELRYGDAKSGYASWQPIALVGTPKNNCFPVTWIANDGTPEELDMISAAREDLDFYLLEVGGYDPWAYACYHCTTNANMYSKVHWSYFPDGQGGKRVSSAVVKGEGNDFFIIKEDLTDHGVTASRKDVRKMPEQGALEIESIKKRRNYCAMKRRLKKTIENDLRNNPLWTEKIEKDCSKNQNVFLAIRNNLIDFYHKGGRLFCFDSSGFKTHLKYASVIFASGKDYLTEFELDNYKFDPCRQ